MRLGQIVAISFAMSLSCPAILLCDSNSAEGASAQSDGTTEKPADHNHVPQKAQQNASTHTFMDLLVQDLKWVSYDAPLLLTFISVYLILSYVGSRFSARCSLF